ncbi:hypothetical protein BKA65DRAFT_498110 [Rhexocercosporidium sp. MPI-PUGE-AT-0058]|nr:hypothetical protein BKA65DRAFT_498110 [Rhexocercosporidium sp. MPI-PUGE-AT-0058]
MPLFFRLAATAAAVHVGMSAYRRLLFFATICSRSSWSFHVLSLESFWGNEGVSTDWGFEIRDSSRDEREYPKKNHRFL